MQANVVEPRGGCCATAGGSWDMTYVSMSAYLLVALQVLIAGSEEIAFVTIADSQFINNTGVLLQRAQHF